MANELERRARFETWIGQLVNAPPTITVEQAGGAAGDGRYMSPDAALAWQAWQAALQQAQQPAPHDAIMAVLHPYLDCGDSRAAPDWAVKIYQILSAQQPGAAFAAWFAEFDKQNHYPELLAREAWNAALRSQQPGAQAVAWRWRLRDGDCWSYTETDPAKHPDYFGESWQVEAVYTDPPPLPEGVSELIRDANRIAEAHVAVGKVLLDRGVTLPRAVREEARDAIEAWNATSESYRARLAARGEKGVQDGT